MASIDTSSLIFTKVVVMVVLTLSSFLCGTVPLLVSRFYEKKTNENNNIEMKAKAQRKRDRIVSLLMAFAGGVLLCTIFIHMVPEIDEVFDDMHNDERYKDLPGFTPQALLCGGFFMMYLSEEIAHKLMHGKKKQQVSEEGPNSDVHVVAMNVLPAVADENRYALSYKNSVFISNVLSIIEEASNDISKEEKQRIVSLVKKALSTSNNPSSETDNPEKSSVEYRRHSQVPHDLELITARSKGLRSFLLLLALSIHAVFEGMAIGLEKKTPAVW